MLKLLMKRALKRAMFRGFEYAPALKTLVWDPFGKAV
jgi:hypothetical protein